MSSLHAAAAASNAPDAQILSRLQRAEVACRAMAGAIAAAVLVGWLVPSAAAVFPSGWSVMKANTAFGVLLCSLSVTLARGKRRPASILAGRACAGVAALLAGAALFEHWSGQRTGLGTLLAADNGSPAPGLMSIQSACCLLLLAPSLTIEPTRRDLGGRVLDVLSFALVSVVLVLVPASVFGAEELLGQSTAVRMSPQTLVCIALLTAVLVSRRAPYGAFSVFVAVGIGSQFARITLPPLIVLCYLMIAGGRHLLASGALTLPYAAAVTASGQVVVLSVLALVVARKLNALDSRLRGLSIADELTGLYNRRGLYLIGEQMLRDGRRAGQTVTVLFVDADGLKAVNDNQGHRTGSLLLLDIAALLRATFRDSDVVGRVGGDEFAVILRGTEADKENALRRLENAIHEMNGASDRPYRISLSVGAATVDPQGDESLDAAVARADAAMYQSKRGRRAILAEAPTSTERATASTTAG